MDRVRNERFSFTDLLNVVFRQLSTVGNLRDDLLVVVGDLQFFRNPAADLSSTASELAAYGDDPFHDVTPPSSGCLVFAQGVQFNLMFPFQYAIIELPYSLHTHCTLIIHRETQPFLFSPIINIIPI